jgi:hypothetical protein
MRTFLAAVLILATASAAFAQQTCVQVTKRNDSPDYLKLLLECGRKEGDRNACDQAHAIAWMQILQCTDADGIVHYKDLPPQ